MQLTKEDFKAFWNGRPQMKPLGYLGQAYHSFGLDAVTVARIDKLRAQGRAGKVTQPNWDKAPATAEAYQPPGPEQYEGWYRKGTSGAAEWWQVNSAGEEQWVWMGGRTDFPYGAIVRGQPK